MKRFRIAAMAALLVCGLVAVASPAGAATKQAKADKSAILQVGADITTQGGGAQFDPALLATRSTSTAGYFYLPAIFDAVVRLDANAKLLPGLATKWDTSDPNVALLTFRKGVKFQDGTDFTTAAVKEAWDRIRTTPQSVAFHDTGWDHITAIDLVGQDQVKVTFDDSSAARFVATIATTSLADVPSPTAYAKDPEGFKTNPIGAGPYKLESFESGQKISLRAWKGYWDKSSQQLAGMDIIQTAPGAPSVASLQAGQINLANIAVSDSAGLTGNPDLTTTNFTNTATTLIMFPCTNKAPFDNADARNAISMAIDRKAVNQAAYAGSGSPTELQFSNGSAYYVPSLDNKHPFNVKKAKALAVKGGIQPGTKITLMLASTTAAEGGDRAAVIIQDNLKQIGIDADIVTAGSFTADQARLNPELIMIASDESVVSSFLKTNQVTNWCKYSNPALDTAITATGTASPGSAEAKAAWKDVQTILSKESPEIYLVRAPVIWAHTKNVKGFEVSAFRKQALIWGIYMTK